jgi:acyl-CoA thioesterase
LSDFDEGTAVSAGGGGHWTGRISGRWNIGDNPNGGYMLATMLRAMQESIRHPDPISVTCHYLRPGVAEAACDIEVDVVRSGRTLSSVRGALHQEGKRRLDVIAAFADLAEPAGLDSEITLEAPSVPDPEDCVPRSAEAQGVHLPILDCLDTRLDPACAVPGGSEEAVIRGMIRFRDGRPPDALACVLFTDSFPPSPLARLGPVGWVPTLELTVHVRRRPAPGWIRAEFRTDDLHEGRMVETGALWDSEGRLVAQSRQVGLVMRRD